MCIFVCQYFSMSCALVIQINKFYAFKMVLIRSKCIFVLESMDMI